MAVTSIDIQPYLQLSKVFKYFPKQDFWTAYDAEADVLYINFHQPALPADDSELTDDDIIIRYKGDEIIGLSILNVSQRYLCTRNMTNFRSPHEKTFQLIKEGLKENKQTYREAFTDTLRHKEGNWSKLKYKLFVHPNSIFWVQIGITIIIIIFAQLLNIKEGNKWSQLIFIIVSMTILFTIPFLLIKITPKFEIGWDKLWPKVLGYYLAQSGNDIKKAKQSLKRAILYYRREGKVLNLLVNFLWGSIFIGCLPDSNFQKALMSLVNTLNVIGFLETNLFGGISVLITPFLSIFYLIKYELPAAWMQNVLTQIELDEE